MYEMLVFGKKEIHRHDDLKIFSPTCLTNWDYRSIREHRVRRKPTEFWCIFHEFRAASAANMSFSSVRKICAAAKDVENAHCHPCNLKLSH